METPGNKTFAEAIRETLYEAMSEDKNVFIIGEDIVSMGGRDGITAGFLDAFGGNRVIETPLNEELFAGIALGAAQTGLRPIVEFAHGSLITIGASDVFLAGIWPLMCKPQEMPAIIIRLRWGGGIVGGQLSIPFISSFYNYIGVSIVSPSTAEQASALLRTAFKEKNKTIIFLEHINLYKKQSAEQKNNPPITIGQAEYRKKGKDISVITHAKLTDIAEDTANELEKSGVEVELLDLISLKPLDLDKIQETARKTKRVLILDEEPDLGGGIFPIVENAILRASPDARIARLGSEKVPVPFGYGNLVLPQKEQIEIEIRKLL